MYAFAVRIGVALAVLLGACGAYGPASPSPSPSTHVFNPHAFTVLVSYADEDRSAALTLKELLPGTWATATANRSTITFVTDVPPDVYVLMGEEPPVQLPYGISQAWTARGTPGLRFIYIHRGVTNPLVVVHEFAHALGVPHWQDCPTPSIEIMCAYQGSATTFSPRELAAMGL